MSYITCLQIHTRISPGKKKKKPTKKEEAKNTFLFFFLIFKNWFPSSDIRMQTVISRLTGTWFPKTNNQGTPALVLGFGQ
jgi:hypothetical protein